MINFIDTLLSLEKQDWEFISVIFGELSILIAYAVATI